MKLKKILQKVLGRFIKTPYKRSYSQCGEDIIVDSLFTYLHVNNPTYIDIGTNTPVSKNNTYLFYSRGCRGVCIEPSPTLAREIKKVRPRDTCLNIGIGPTGKVSADYYIMTSKALNTFSKDEADKYMRDKNYGIQNIETVIKIPLHTINEILETYSPTGPDFLSIDTEGLDFDILQSLNWQKYRPKVVCVETARYEGNVLKKEDHIINFMKNNAYVLYADTFINSIFVDNHILNKISI